MVSTSPRRSLTLATAGLGLVAALVVASVSTASAAVTTNGPLNLGTAETFSVLANQTITNTGPTVLSGDLGLSPGTAVTGFGGPGNGRILGDPHVTDATALQAQNDTTTAYNVAASLTPTTSGVGELAGRSLTPGVYNGGAIALSNNGALTLAGTANSIWVFQAASSLTIGSGTRIIITGGATACNVFWQVGSSATIGTAAQFQGTILAQTSITATTSATVAGRLLARTGAVTLDTNTITNPTNCATPGTPTGTPAPTGTGTPVPTDSGTPVPTDSGTPSPTDSGTPSPTDSGTPSPTDTPSTPGAPAPTASASPSNTAVPAPTSTSPAGTPPLGGGGTGSGGGFTGNELAETGTDTTPILVIGGLVLLAGLGMVTAVGFRRRQVLPTVK